MVSDSELHLYPVQDLLKVVVKELPDPAALFLLGHRQRRRQPAHLLGPVGHARLELLVETVERLGSLAEVGLRGVPQAQMMPDGDLGHDRPGQRRQRREIPVGPDPRLGVDGAQ